MDQISGDEYKISVQRSGDDQFKKYLQGILNKHHETAYPLMDVPESRKFIISIADKTGKVVGGALFWAYWGWLDVSLLAVEVDYRGLGLGRRLMSMIEKEALEEKCHKIRVETFENELGFYQKMGYREVGQLEDYPDGYTYYWMRKDI